MQGHIYIIMYFFMYFSINLFIHLVTYLFACLFVYLFINLFVCYVFGPFSAKVFKNEIFVSPTLQHDFPFPGAREKPFKCL